MADTSEWKKDFAAISLLADDTIVIGPKRIRSGRGQTEIEAEAITPVDQETVWSRSLLASVIKIANRIDLSTWPKPACFAFANGRGFVAGKQ